MENEIEMKNEDGFVIEAEYRSTDDEITERVREVFGVSYLFPWQRIVIANILDAVAGKNTNDLPDETDTLAKQIVLLPTGAGKSLCFQVPALFLNGPTLVIYPLLALMADQQRRMDSGGLGSVIFRGGQTFAQREENFARIKNGSAKIIIANPEVLQDDRLLPRLSECQIAHIAIDEAHCVSEWGDSFRPAYLTLGEAIKKLGTPVITAFTATASPEVLARVSEILFGGANAAHIVRSESDRPNIHYHVRYAGCKKEEALRLAQTEARPMIIFCGTRARAEDLARSLVACYGDSFAKFYHAGLERDEKTEIEKWFFAAEDAVLCATCAYGMGVDKRNIRTVVHLDPPETAEAYIQEAGRGGRDGTVANAILLWNIEDSLAFAGKNKRAQVIKNFAESTSCRRHILLQALGAEEADSVACDGCDICDGTTKTAQDMKIAYEFIRKKSGRYDKDELTGKILERLNDKYPLPTNDRNRKLRIWTADAATSILEQFLASGIVATCPKLWDNALKIAPEQKLTETAKKFIPRLLHPRRLHFWAVAAARQA